MTVVKFMPQKILFLAGVNPIFKLGESQLDQNEHRREIGGERKSLLMSLCCIRVAHKKEARCILLGEQS